jgi:hypothetical protein
VEFRALIAAAAVLLLAARTPQARIRVEVVNTTKVRGLAHRATRYLRDQGYDVVSARTVVAPRDTTLVLDRTNHPEWAARIARALGTAGAPVRAESRPDSSRYVDVTVLLGAVWRPPPQAFNP